LRGNNSTDGACCVGATAPVSGLYELLRGILGLFICANRRVSRNLLELASNASKTHRPCRGSSPPTPGTTLKYGSVVRARPAVRMPSLRKFRTFAARMSGSWCITCDDAAVTWNCLSPSCICTFLTCNTSAPYNISHTSCEGSRCACRSVTCEQ